MRSTSIKNITPEIINILTVEFGVSQSTVYDALKQKRTYGRTQLIRRRAIDLAIKDLKKQIKKLEAIKS